MPATNKKANNNKSNNKSNNKTNKNKKNAARSTVKMTRSNANRGRKTYWERPAGRGDNSRRATINALKAQGKLFFNERNVA